MELFRKALDVAAPRIVRRLGMLSLLLVLVLTGHGIWLLHTMAEVQWQHEAETMAETAADRADLMFDVAVAMLDAAETAVRTNAPIAPSPSLVRALSNTARLVFVDAEKPGSPDAGALATLAGSPLYRPGAGSPALKVSRLQRMQSTYIVVWKDLADNPKNFVRAGVFIPEADFLCERRKVAVNRAGVFLGQARLIVQDDPVPAQANAHPDDVLHRHPLARTTPLAEVRLAHRLIAETSDAHTAPLFASIFLGTALLVVALLALNRMAARQEREAQELRDVRALALTAHRSKGALHAAVSHELSLPISGIIGVAKLLQTDLRRVDAHRLVSIMLMSARNLQAVVKDILDRALHDSAQTVTAATPTNPLSVGMEVVDLFYANAIAQGIDLTFVSASSAQRVLVDAFALRQVLANLVGNALKHTQRGGVTVSCALTETGSAAEHAIRLRFEVKDTGGGIEPGELREIFVAKGPSDAEGGPPRVGLAVARRLVSQMGGDLEVQSNPGKGSCFWFELLVAAAPPEAPLAAPAWPGSTEKNEESDARILVVEDNPVSAMVTETQLRSLGYRCDVAPDGEGALAAMAVGGYDLVLMDCTLPGLSGHDITQHWRSFEKRNNVPPLPIIALTAKSMNMHMQQCLDVGMSDFLAKPCSAETLGLTIEKWLRHVRARPSVDVNLQQPRSNEA